MKYTKKEIKNIIFTMSNHECVKLPISCFDKLDINILENNKYEIEAVLLDKGASFILTSNPLATPLQRLSISPDIVDICIELINGEEVIGEFIWKSKNYSSNLYQKTALKSYNELHLSIKESNLKLSLYQVLKLKPGTIVIDQNGVEYTIKKDKKLKYLDNTIVSNKILNSKFTVKNK